MTLAVIDAFGNTFCIGDIINGYFPQELEFKHGDIYFTSITKSIHNSKCHYDNAFDPD